MQIQSSDFRLLLEIFCKNEANKDLENLDKWKITLIQILQFNSS